jgi:hypothetical protein
MRWIEFFLGHFQRTFEQFVSFRILLFKLAANSIGKINNPIDRMIVRDAREYLYSTIELFLG